MVKKSHGIVSLLALAAATLTGCNRGTAERPPSDEQAAIAMIMCPGNSTLEDPTPPLAAGGQYTTRLTCLDPNGNIALTSTLTADRRYTVNLLPVQSKNQTVGIDLQCPPGSTYWSGTFKPVVQVGCVGTNGSKPILIETTVDQPNDRDYQLLRNNATRATVRMPLLTDTLG